MRICTVFAVALFLPSVASAQLRAPRIGERPGEPVGREPQPEPIARSQAMVRSRYTIEAYPLISRIQAPGIVPGSPLASWTSFGSGTHLDYRYTQYLSWTMDLTGSYLGGPTTETVEVGTRFRPAGWDYRLRPYADLRVGFENANDVYSTPGEVGIGPAAFPTAYYQESRGVGAIAGTGVDYALTSTFALTTGVSAMRANMMPYNYSGNNVAAFPVTNAVAPSGNSYTMTTYRLTIGLKYNPAYAPTSMVDRTH
jgi:hypothetical protein